MALGPPPQGRRFPGEGVLCALCTAGRPHGPGCCRERLQQGSRSGGGAAAPVNLHNRSDSARILIRRKHRGRSVVGLEDGAAHRDRTSHGVSPFRLMPFRRVPALRDLHQALCP